MKILMLTDNYYPSVGGAERQVATLGKKLIEGGHEVFVITEQKASSLKLSETVDHIPVIRIPFPKIRWIGALFLFVRLAGYLIKYRHRYNVIHVHIVKYFAFVAALMGRILGKKVILKLSGWEELDLGILSEAHRKKWLFKILTWGIKKGSYYIAVSKKIEDRLKACQFPEEKIRFIPNGVDTNLFSPGAEKDSARKRLGLSGFPIGVFVGRLVKEKGLEDLVYAWKDVIQRPEGASGVLLLIGSGYLSAELKKKVQDEGLLDKIVFVGETPNVLEYLKAADFFVLPSLIEGLSNSLLEAMACALPVIATRTSGSEDLVIDGQNGYTVDIHSPKGLAEAILRLIQDRPSLSSMGKRSREIVAGRYAIDKTVSQYLNIYGHTDGKWDVN